jgi:hypothetical protein
LRDTCAHGFLDGLYAVVQVINGLGDAVAAVG